MRDSYEDDELSGGKTRDEAYYCTDVAYILFETILYLILTQNKLSNK